MGDPFDDQYVWQEEELVALKGSRWNLSLLGDRGIDWRNKVWMVRGHDDNIYIAKSIPKDTPEVPVWLKMRSIQSPRNLTVPGELIDCSVSYLLVMPRYDVITPFWAKVHEWDVILDIFQGIIEFVQLMHENNVAFVDISPSNIMWSRKGLDYGGFHAAPKDYHFIDFGSARLLPSGPGSNVVITDWGSAGGKYEPPEGRDVVDPYAYDIYALARTLRSLLAIAMENPTIGRIPSYMQLWLSSIGCDDPRLRPPIAQVRRQFIALRFWQSCTSPLRRVFSTDSVDTLTSYGWRIISPFIV